MKKLIMVVLMVALFAGAVGVGVHVLNKEARADDFYYAVKCLQWNQFEMAWIPVQGIVVEITIDGSAPTEHQTGQDGMIVIVKNFSAAWTAEIVDFQGLDFVAGSPVDDNPAEFAGPLSGQQVWWLD